MESANAPRQVVARAPTRIDFGGGWTDVPPYSEEVGGVVCSAAIAIHATVRVAVPANSASSLAAADSPRDPLVAAALRRAGLDPDDMLELELRCDYPVGAGLGGSSAAGVALVGALAAWRGERLLPTELAEQSRALEVEDLGIAGGRQDHYSAVLGGAQELTFGSGGKVISRRLELTPAVRAALESRCIVAYTGEARVSAATISGVMDSYRRGDRRVTEALDRLRSLALSMAVALEAGDLEALGELVSEHWQHQRTLHPAIPTPRIDSLLAAASTAGALGGKALGASGGGCILAVAAAGREEEVRRALACEARVLPVTLDLDGFRLLND